MADPPRHSRLFWLQFTFLCSVLGLCEAARGIVIPTLSLYVANLGGSSTFLSFVVAAFSVGRLSSSVVLGAFSDHSGLLPILLASVAITCMGHVLFIMAGGLSSGGLYLLLFSRVLTGFGTGTLSVCRSFVSKETQPSERTRFMSWLGIVQFAGYAFTPILGGLEVSWAIAGTWTINTFTAGTYALLVLDVLLLLALYFGLRGHGAEQMEEEENASKAVDMITAEATGVEHAAVAGKREGDENHSGEDERVKVTADPLDDAIGAVQTAGGRTKRGYTTLDSNDQPISDYHNHAPTHYKPHNDEEEMTADSLHHPAIVLTATRAAAEHERLEMEEKCPTPTMGLPDGRVSFASLPSPIVIPATSKDDSGAPIGSPANRHQRAHSAVMPTLLLRRMSFSISRPPTPSQRNTTAPAGLTASTLATLAAPSLPRDVLSSDTLSLYLQPPAPFPLNQPSDNADGSSATPSSSPWRTRLTHVTARLSYYTTPALLIPAFFLLLNAASRGCLAVAETYGSTLYYTVQYGANYDPTTVSPLGAAWFYTALGAVGVVVFVLMDSFTHFLNELTLLCWGFIAMCLGFVTVLDTDGSVVNLAISMSMIYCIATPITQTLVSSMLSKQLPKQQQGKWMGLLTAAGSIGRIVFPLLSGALYELGSTSAALLLPAVIAMCAVSGIVVGLKVWQLWWAYWVRVEQKLEGWQERREAGRGRRLAARRDSRQELEESWLTIEEVMERMEQRRKRREKRERQQPPHDGVATESSAVAGVEEFQSLIAVVDSTEQRRAAMSVTEVAGESKA